MSDDLVKRLRNTILHDGEWESGLGLEAADRIEELEVKLAKAVEDLQDMLTIPNSEAAQGILKAYARALIAELTGGKDDKT